MAKLADVFAKISGGITGGYKKMETGVVNGYKKIETGVVNGYKKIEAAAVSGFGKVADKCVEVLFTRSGETVAQAKRRLQGKKDED